ncbi:unnamed protein product [Withania somnifera]
MDEANNTCGEIEKIIEDIEQRSKQIKNFDILYCPPYDRHFFEYDRNSKNMASDSAFPERIETEWLLLEDKLPSSRLVRNYPNCPPRLHYYSYDLPLNQNLDPKGKVSLSLLECGNFVTNWYSVFNILQVLQAIQTSILITNLLNPSGGEGSQVSHNSEWLKYKKAFTLACKGMLYMLRGPTPPPPPMNFQDFVEGYFRTRAHYILLNFWKQMDDSDFMFQLYHELYRAFEQNGTYCKQRV